MKKILLLLISVALVFSFVGCKDELMGVSIEDDNSAKQFNYDFEGTTLTYSEAFAFLSKTTTVTGTGTTPANSTSVEYLPIRSRSWSMAFGEMTDGVGKFTATYSETVLPEAVATHTNTATVTYGDTTDYDDKQSGLVILSESVSGTYSVLETEDKTMVYEITLASASQTKDSAYVANGNALVTSYTAAGTTTSAKSFTDIQRFLTPGLGAGNNTGYLQANAEKVDSDNDMMITEFDVDYSGFNTRTPNDLWTVTKD